MPDYEKIALFLDEYNGFFAKYSNFQKSKLEDVLSNKLIRLDESLKSGEKLQMELNNMENKRLSLLKEQGLEGKSFKEIITLAPTEYKMRMQEIYENVLSNISDSDFHNKKAMSVLEGRMNDLFKKNSLPKTEHHTLSKKI